MAVNVTDWNGQLLHVPKSDLTPTGDPQRFVLDMEWLRFQLHALEYSEPGETAYRMHTRVAPIPVGSITKPQAISIINGWTLEFEPGDPDPYMVTVVGADTNLSDLVVLNNVSVRAELSTGTVQVSTGSGSGSDPWIIPTANPVPGSYGELVQDTNQETGRIKRMAQAILGLVAGRR